MRGLQHDEFASSIDDKSGLLTPTSSEEDVFEATRAHALVLQAKRRRRVRRFRFITVLALLFLALFHLAGPRRYASKALDPEWFEFDDLRDLTIAENIDSNCFKVLGTVHVSPDVDDNLKRNFRVTVAPTFTSEYDWSHVSIKPHNGLSITSSTPKRGCYRWWKKRTISFGVGVIVANGTSIENFTIDTRNLGISVDTATPLSVTDQTTLTADNGIIMSDFISKVFAFKSRKTIVETSNGSIQGAYALHDLLSLDSRNGNVDVQVLPKQANKDDPEPATLLISSRSGDIKAQVNEADLPDRDYRTKVSNRNGIIHGKFVHGSSTEFDSGNGGIVANILPYDASTDKSTYLTTSNCNGETQVSVRPPVKPATDGSMGSLISKHTSSNGAVRLNYADVWAGKFEGRSSNGRIAVHGKDVEIIHRGEKQVEGKKGKDGNGDVTFKSTNGDIELAFA